MTPSEGQHTASAIPVYRQEGVKGKVAALIFWSRWLQLPIYLGLIVVQRGIRLEISQPALSPVNTA